MPAVCTVVRCLTCNEAIPAWQRLLPLRHGRPVLTEDGDFAIQSSAPGACPGCGAAGFEVRVVCESEPPITQ